ncbi:MAG: hypothetical protein R3C39_12705 [Dehalococcoidia bacterium]
MAKQFDRLRMLGGTASTMFALLAVAAVSACGGADDDGDAGSSGPVASASTQAVATESSSGGGGLASIESGSGTFSIDGQQFDADIVVRCLPFDASAFGGAAPNEADFDFSAATSDFANVVEGEVAFALPTFGPGAYEANQIRGFASRQGSSGVEQYESVAATDPDGNWLMNLEPQLVANGQPPTGEPMEFEIDGNHVRGAMTLEQNWPDGATGTVDIAFDLDLPAEAIDCSLRD